MSIIIAQGHLDNNLAVKNNGVFAPSDVPYFVFGAGTEEEALAEALVQVPTSYNGLQRQGIKISERINESNFKVIASYAGASGRLETADEDGEAFSFYTTGGTQTITQSRETIAGYAKPGEIAPDLQGAINYDGENVNGVEIVQPVLDFTETAIFDAGEITTGFRKTLASLTGCINAMSWRGYSPGEVLFRGVSGSGKTNLPCEITFNFSFSAHRREFTVGDITVTEKYGWDYMWVRYTDKVEEGCIVRKPAAVYIERIFEAVDFSKLGIGR